MKEFLKRTFTIYEAKDEREAEQTALGLATMMMEESVNLINKVKDGEIASLHFAAKETGVEQPGTWRDLYKTGSSHLNATKGAS